MNHSIIPYNHLEYGFEKMFKELFKCDDLYKLHTTSKETYPELFKVGADSSTVFHSTFYSKLHAGWPEFEQAYLALIKNIIAPDYPNGFVFQASPTFRLHIPRNVCVGAFHDDRAFGHPPKEINYIVPITRAFSTASVWIESEPGKGDYEYVDMRLGEIICFNGNELSHGSKVNLTKFSRLSFDFRVLPIEHYNPNYEGTSVTRKTKFVVGEYYKKFDG